jgi:ABC-type Mn2+/Zn2+ transport system permease subunit
VIPSFSKLFDTMGWPLMACLFLPGLLVWLGMHSFRRSAFLGTLALAQLAALGICVAVFFGASGHDTQSLLISVACTIVGAGVLNLARGGKGRMPTEAAAGAFYVVAAGFAVALLSRHPDGDETLRKTLVGQVLLLTRDDFVRTAGIYLGLSLVCFFLRKKFSQIPPNPESPTIERRWNGREFIFYSIVGIAMASFIPIGGILLGFAYLLIPAASATVLFSSALGRLLFGWLLASGASAAALGVAFKKDLPTGPLIVCSLGVVFIICTIIRSFRK